MLSSKEDFLFFISTVTVAIFLILFFFFFVLIQNVRIRNRKNIEVLNAILKTEENERNRIAADLHDELGPMLSAIKLEVEDVMNGLADPERVANLTTTSLQLDTVIQNIRWLSKSMSSASITKFGLIKSLEDFGAILTRHGKIRFSFIHELTSEKLSEFAQSTIYRIIQELLTNSIRHSNCTEINLAITYESPHLQIEYEDNGSSVVPGKSDETGSGLRNIKSRVNVLHGNFNEQVDFSAGSHYVFTFDMKHLV